MLDVSVSAAPCDEIRDPSDSYRVGAAASV
jgi:hypothetical protein